MKRRTQTSTIPVALCVAVWMTAIFALAAPNAFAGRKCSVTLKVSNKAGVSVMVMWLKAKRVGKSWVTLFNGRKTLNPNSTYTTSVTLKGNSCKKSYQTQIAYKCSNKTTGTQTTSGTLRGTKKKKMTVGIGLETKDCS